MEFIKKMKKREFIEMSLKALAALLVAFMAIILMEGMIYSIQLNSLYNSTSSLTTVTNSTTAYCIPQSDDMYFIVCCIHQEDGNKWTSHKTDSLKSKENCIKRLADLDIAEEDIQWRAPNAFELSVDALRLSLMIIVLVGAVGGYFAYRFVSLAKQYKKIEDEFQRTGTIEITNA